MQISQYPIPMQKYMGRTRDGRVENVKLISDRKIKGEIIVKDSSFVLNI